MSNEQVKMICSQRCVGACHEYTADTASPGGTIAHGRRKSRMRAYSIMSAQTIWPIAIDPFARVA